MVGNLCGSLEARVSSLPSPSPALPGDFLSHHLVLCRVPPGAWSAALALELSTGEVFGHQGLHLCVNGYAKTLL